MVTNSFKECIDDEKSVVAAVSALKVWCEQQSNKTDQKTPLFDEDGHSSIFIQLTMKKVPPLRHLENTKILLPHACWNDPEDLCLFVPDLDKRKPDDDATIHHYRILLQNLGATVREIITLHQLRTEYHTFESRRRLVGSYNVFLCDGRLSKMMPSLLGKIFLNKRKMPINVDLRRRDLQHRINAAVSKTSLIISGHGTSCSCQVGNFNQTADEIVSNVVTALKGIDEKLPGGGENVAAVHLKTPKSVAIPIYMTLETADNVKFAHQDRKEKPVVDELTTDNATSVMVYPSGHIIEFPSHEMDGIAEDEIERKVLWSTRSAKEKLRGSFSRKGQTKRKKNFTNKAITKSKDKVEKKKKLARSARLSFKSKQGYKLATVDQPKSPSAKLLSVKKRSVDEEKPAAMPLRENRKSKGVLNKIHQQPEKTLLDNKRKGGKRAALTRQNKKTPNELKGILKKGKATNEDGLFSGKRSKRVKRKRDLMAVVRKPSLLAKHM